MDVDAGELNGPKKPLYVPVNENSATSSWTWTLVMAVVAAVAE